MLHLGFLVRATTVAIAPPAAPGFTGGQLDVFSSMVGESRDIVAQRLYRDPSLAALAIRAADQRAYRLRSGKRMAILGFTGLGLGAAAAVLGGVFWANDNSVCNDDDQSGCSFQGLFYLNVIVAGILGAVAGVTVGVLGIRKLGEPWQAEREAMARYQDQFPPRLPAPPPTAPSLPVGPAGMSFSVPLLSGGF